MVATRHFHWILFCCSAAFWKDAKFNIVWFSLLCCRWYGYARTPSWPWRIVLHTSWTCCQTLTSISALSCPAMKARWKRWATTSIFAFSWRTWPRRPNRPLASSKTAKSECSRRTLSPGERRWVSVDTVSVITAFPVAKLNMFKKDVFVLVCSDQI